MHHELLNMYAVAWLFAFVALAATAVYFAVAWRLRAKGRTIPVRWDSFYSGFAIGMMFALFTCLIISHHAPGPPHF